MSGKLSSPKMPTLGLVILECRQTTNVAQAMHKELRMAWSIAVERLSGTWEGWCLACGQKRSLTVCISQCNRKSLFYPQVLSVTVQHTHVHSLDNLLDPRSMCQVIQSTLWTAHKYTRGIFS